MIAQVLVAALLGQAGGAASPPQPAQPDPEWSQFPGEPSPPPARADEPGAQPGQDSLTHLPIPPTIEQPLTPSELPLPPPKPEAPNRWSLFGAAALGPGHRAAALGLGFPVLGGRAMMGVTRNLDLGVSYETLYGLMHDVRAQARWHLASKGMIYGGLVADVGPAWFSRPPATDPRGARWLTGRRNYNASGGLVVSIQGSEPRASRFFASARFLLTADTEPISSAPLGGTPPAVQFAPNFIGEIGLEAPASEWISLAFRVGLDIHGRSEDAPVMVNGTAGVVTALP
ncbi:MAG TPA: hypothetical protein VND93_25820 [Myxococcales bacterium]|nr:hypothetical protein [Myxococcales bacterium]